MQPHLTTTQGALASATSISAYAYSRIVEIETLQYISLCIGIFVGALTLIKMIRDWNKPQK